jgi:integrase
VFARDLLVVTDELAAELDRWLRHYRQAVGGLRSDFVLLPTAIERQHGPDRVRTYRPNTPMAHPERVVGRALAAIGVVTERQGYHDLRRSMARLRYDDLVASEGKDDALAVVSALLGHSTRAMTEHYIGTNGDRTRRDAVMASAAWRPVATPDETAPSSLAKVIPLTR